MRGYRTAYLAESVKLFSFTASSATLTLRADERNKCLKTSARWRVPLNGQPFWCKLPFALQRNCLFAPHLKFTVFERFRPGLNLAAGDTLDVSD